LRTIKAARDYMLALPDHRELRKSWHAAKLILESGRHRRR
jgi:hypothetical protein